MSPKQKTFKKRNGSTLLASEPISESRLRNRNYSVVSSPSKNNSINLVSQTITRGSKRNNYNKSMLPDISNGGMTTRGLPTRGADS